MVQAFLDRPLFGDGRPKLSDTVAARRPGGFQTLTALPSNIQAIEAGMRFADGTHPFVAVFGPSGWGKSHLLVAVADHMNREAPGSAVVVSSLQWLRHNGRPEPAACLLVDDLQDVLNHPRARHLFRQQVDHRVRTGRRTLLAWNVTDSTKKVRSLIPSLRQWFTVEICEPTLGERELVVLQIAARMGLQLSRPIARLVAKHLNGNARSIEGALRRLKLAKSTWDDPCDVIAACGVLSPYLLGHDGWDPRDHVQDAVTKALATLPCPLSLDEVYSHFMLHEMGLSEGEVASFLGVSPATAYCLAKRVRERAEDPAVQAQLCACRIAVIRGFEEA